MWKPLSAIVLFLMTAVPASSVGASPGLVADDPDTLPALLRTARSKNTAGEFAEAESLYRHCLDVAEQTLGPAHPVAAQAANGLGLCLANLGDYAGAEKTLRRSLTATITLHGDMTAEAGDLMLTLGEVLAKRGNHAESTELFRRAVEIMEEVHGPDHERYAASLSGLAHTKRRIGNMAEAEALYRRAIQIVEAGYGDRHPDLIHYKCRLGMTLSNVRRYTEGLESIEAGIALATDIHGRDSYQVAIEERHRGLLLNELKRFEEARSVFLRSLATLELRFGPAHPHLSKCLKGLAASCYYLDRHAEALRFATRAASLYGDAGGSDQTELAFVLAVKACIELYLEDWDAARQTKLQEARTALTELERVYGISSTEEAIQTAWLPNAAARSLVGITLADPDVADSALEDAFRYLAMTQGQVLDWLAERRRVRGLGADTTHFTELRGALSAASQRVADLVIRGPQGDSKAYAASLAAARRELDEAEWALSNAFERSRREAQTRRLPADLSSARMADALDRGATLLHFIRFNRWLRPESSLETQWLVSYGAFRLRPGPGSAFELDFVDLGPAAPLDSLVFAYRRSIEGIEPGRRPTAREEAAYRAAAGGLYDQVWEPLMETRDGTSLTEDPADHSPLVFVIPDSWLHLVDFNTLVSPRGPLVIEAWRVHYFSSAGDLLRPPSEESRGSGLLAVGDPAYTDLTAETPLAAGPGDAGTSPTPCREAYRPPGPLPGAERETRAVAELYSSLTREPVTLLLKDGATEHDFKRHARGKRVIHVATHGFRCEETTRESIPYPARIANSLFKSGLYLAPGRGGDDGLLTAYEVTCLDLGNTDWVVLSACGSGLGWLLQHEGLFGMRRAFEIAGARTVIVAMWQIDDDAMGDLMLRIFEGRLQGMSTVDAVRRAQLDRLRDQRRRLNRTHPTLWGGIVAEGDWR